MRREFSASWRSSTTAPTTASSAANTFNAPSSATASSRWPSSASTSVMLTRRPSSPAPAPPGPKDLTYGLGPNSRTSPTTSLSGSTGKCRWSAAGPCPCPTSSTRPAPTPKAPAWPQTFIEEGVTPRAARPSSTGTARPGASCCIPVPSAAAQGLRLDAAALPPPCARPSSTDAPPARSPRIAQGKKSRPGDAPITTPSQRLRPRNHRQHTHPGRHRRNTQRPGCFA